MNELSEVVGKPWQRLIADACPPDTGFESQFSWLKNTQVYDDELDEVEDIISSYFRECVIPDQPTIYDYLVLGLQGKDVIATFNWDPLLMLAHERNRGISGLELPDIRFLHGSVYYSSCLEHDVLACPGEQCPKCEIPLANSRLIFPLEDKDYGQDSLISRDWATVTNKLTDAFHLTIFGYSGPRTDHKAKQMLRDGSKSSMRRSLRRNLTTGVDCRTGGDTPPYPGILRNNLSTDQNASAYINAPSRNGAPGSSIGALGEVK
jgi:hypothetical protein